MRVLFLFLDGVGLGSDEPETNPFAWADMPYLQGLLGGQRLLLEAVRKEPTFSPAEAGFSGGPTYWPLETERATLLALDACLGVSGLPQSATGQAVLLTGQNVPERLGYHYGPKPNQSVARILRNGNLFSRFQQQGRRSALLNAYPPRYFEAIHSGRRMYSAIPLAVISAGLKLKTTEDLRSGKALSADFTARGWRLQTGFPEVPVLEPCQAGNRLAELALDYDFSLFEYWLSDYAGHHQDRQAAGELLETFDQVLAGLLEAWSDDEGLVLVTSDHGNLEDLGTRRHTANPVPGLLIGAPETRHRFAEGLSDLTGIAPRITELLTQSF